MTVPVTGNIQFMPPGGVFLTVDSISDPGGAPADVLDVDQGFTVKGTVVLPNWLAGTGTVTVYADEQGGPIDRALQPSATITLAPSNTEPNPKTYPWQIDFLGNVLPDPAERLADLPPAGEVHVRGSGHGHRRVRGDRRLPRQLGRAVAGALARRGAGDARQSSAVRVAHEDSD